MGEWGIVVLRFLMRVGEDVKFRKDGEGAIYVKL